MIEVGEYVRLESGIHNGIRKIIGRDEDGHLLIDISFCGGKWLTFTEEAEIEKHSKNIIDLIEVGDYVNGEKVLKINCKLEYIDDDSETGVNEVYNAIETTERWIYFGEEIETISTPSGEYRVKEH